MPRKTGREIEWWYGAAVKHSSADEDCGRPWQCACGPCRAAREETEAKSHADLVMFGARRGAAYSRAIRESDG